MRILYSSKIDKIDTDSGLRNALNAVVSERFLREIVDKLSFPRHYFANPQTNQHIEEWIADQLRSYGYHVFLQGKYDNVVALPSKDFAGPVTLVGAHYDSVPWSPGADDNASAIAALLGCAKTVAKHTPDAPVCFVAFNREEDWMIGSADFVKNYMREKVLDIRIAHILEMVGYCSHQPNSQRSPRSLPVNIPSIGNFLGIISNHASRTLLPPFLQEANSYCPDLPVVGLQIYWGLEKFFYHLIRSDHVAFWKHGISAFMWTDTAYCRNPNYHKASDTSETLDYTFLRKVTQLLTEQVLMFSF